MATISHFRISACLTACRNRCVGKTSGNRQNISSACTVVNKQSMPPNSTAVTAACHGLKRTQSINAIKIILCIFSRYFRVSFIGRPRIIRACPTGVNGFPCFGNVSNFFFIIFFMEIDRVVVLQRYAAWLSRLAVIQGCLNPHLARMPSSSSRLLYLRMTLPRPLLPWRMVTW